VLAAIVVCIENCTPLPAAGGASIVPEPPSTAPASGPGGVVVVVAEGEGEGEVEDEEDEHPANRTTAIKVESGRIVMGFPFG
jgi:hypothetical protein